MYELVFKKRSKQQKTTREVTANMKFKKTGPKNYK